MNTSERTPQERERTARALAGATEARLAELWEAWPDRPEIEYLRGPEAGIVMVQGRVGGSGDRFNLGEATVTRATVAVRTSDEQTVGTAYVLGSRPDHAALAAIFDGLLGTQSHERVLHEVIEPLEQEQQAQDVQARRDARATVVDFFTVSRENDAFGASDDEDGE